MKKLLFSTALSIILIGSGTLATAQGMALNRYNPKATNPYPEATNKIVNEADVNINAVRDFRKNFKKATNEKWVQNENGASVYFTIEGAKMRASYNGKGKKEYTLKYYEEDAMPIYLRRQIKSNYYDHEIVIVTEVSRNHQTFYLVKMENKREFLTIKVADDEMTVFEKISRL
jgi:hypothetical protein